ncbi:flavin-binding monooxygenase [Diplodia corticola]|uniref:Flavin-binding monooxygenase n=1 Tax=Diplodia corticola TaxID=236234 RepID=A0A1J9RDP4_9PEZI|nr:flavin-binding monooxygenase [Diplodia corticola]OJD38561.1 flavin-binding monooxygenase [Diplodia corticola]
MRKGDERVIHHAGGYGPDAYTYYPVLIIGAGESGIATACRLKDGLGHGFDQFRLVERQSGVGGTWWINRYPGVACDVPGVFYSFSFAPFLTAWKKFFPPGADVVEYLERVCEEWGVADKVTCGCEVKAARWDAGEGVWEVELWHLRRGVGDLSYKDRERLVEEGGEEAVVVRKERVRAKVVVSCVGGLVEPRGWPEEGVPGRERFEGRVFHSARWEHGVDVREKDVVVVGTGCSAAQLVPKLVKEEFGAKSVTQIMRSPPWVVPRGKPPGGDEWWERWSPALMAYVPGLERTLRLLTAAGAEYDFRLFKNGEWNEKERKKLEGKLLEHMRETVPEKYHEMLTPDYGVGCKRRIFDATWFPGLKDSRIELTTQPLTAVNEKSVTLGPGRVYPKRSEKEEEEAERTIPADIIVMANGFDTTKWLHPLKVVGRDGQDLVEVMEQRGGPQAYQGTAMDGFPNFFMIFGPNTATGHSSVILATENMVNYALKFIKPIVRGDADTVEVKKEAEEDYTRDVQRSLKDTVFAAGGCNSWYFDKKTGWNSTVYPYTQIWFGLRCMFPVWSDWNITYTKKGLLKLYLQRGLRVLTALVLVIGGWTARQRGLTATNLRVALRLALGILLDRGIGLLRTAKQLL